MIAHSVPLVKFRMTVINLANVNYALVKRVPGEYGRPDKWKFTITMSVENQNIYWSFNSKAEAEDAMDEFLALNQTYMMSEFP